MARLACGSFFKAPPFALNKYQDLRPNSRSVLGYLELYLDCTPVSSRRVTITPPIRLSTMQHFPVAFGEVLQAAPSNLSPYYHHRLAHSNDSALLDITLSGGTVSHVCAESPGTRNLDDPMESSCPYDTRHVTITPNDGDPVIQTETKDHAGPGIKYFYRGNDPSERLFELDRQYGKCIGDIRPYCSFIWTSAGTVTDLSDTTRGRKR